MPQIDAESQRIRRLSELFQVLSDETRLKIIQALEKRELCVSDIAKRVGVSQPAVSHQLSTLRQTDLVREQRVGQRIYYRIADGRIFCIIRDGLDHVKEER
jgi:ArsR family transcriptional regulator